MYLLICITVATAFTVAWGFIPSLIRLADEYGFTDAPDERKVHSGAVPRIGGVAIFAGTLIGALFSCVFDHRLLGYLAGALIIFILGLLDDKNSLSANTKLFWQLIAVAVMLLVGNLNLVTLDDLPFGIVIPLGLASWPVTVFLMLCVINAVNLIDGLDGLASGISIIATTSMSFVAYLTGNSNAMLIGLAAAGASSAFFIFNRHPAKIFMGDSGSLFLGYTLASLSVMLVKDPSPVGLTIPLFLLLVPVGDVFYVAISRKARGARIFEADRTHIHHRLLDRGLSHRGAVRAILVLSLVIASLVVGPNMARCVTIGCAAGSDHAYDQAFEVALQKYHQK